MDDQQKTIDIITDRITTLSDELQFAQDDANRAGLNKVLGDAYYDLFRFDRQEDYIDYTYLQTAIEQWRAALENADSQALATLQLQVKIHFYYNWLGNHTRNPAFFEQGIIIGRNAAAHAKAQSENPDYAYVYAALLHESYRAYRSSPKYTLEPNSLIVRDIKAVLKRFTLSIPEHRALYVRISRDLGNLYKELYRKTGSITDWEIAKEYHQNVIPYREEFPDDGFLSLLGIVSNDAVLAFKKHDMERLKSVAPLADMLLVHFDKYHDQVTLTDALKADPEKFKLKLLQTNLQIYGVSHQLDKERAYRKDYIQIIQKRGYHPLVIRKVKISGWVYPLPFPLHYGVTLVVKLMGLYLWLRGIEDVPTKLST